jgi:hypothetical protein
MKFAVKICDVAETGRYFNERWDHYDDPRVNSNLDAHAYGLVMAEYWNNDLRPGEYPMRVLNAQVLGPGSNKKRLPAPDPRQLDLLRPSRRTQQ